MRLGGWSPKSRCFSHPGFIVIKAWYTFKGEQVEYVGSHFPSNFSLCRWFKDFFFFCHDSFILENFTVTVMTEFLSYCTYSHEIFLVWKWKSYHLVKQMQWWGDSCLCSKTSFFSKMIFVTFMPFSFFLFVDLQIAAIFIMNGSSWSSIWSINYQKAGANEMSFLRPKVKSSNRVCNSTVQSIILSAKQIPAN